MNRREFLKRMGVLGGGIIIGFNTLDRQAWARRPRTGFLGGGIPTDFNAFLRIGADNRVALYTGKIEMGQGAMTSIPQLLAEELHVVPEPSAPFPSAISGYFCARLRARPEGY
jgi:isoquinoline 1-oxidoreductase